MTSDIQPVAQPLRDTIPRARIAQLIDVLLDMSVHPDEYTFEDARTLLSEQSLRASTGAGTAMFTTTREVISDLRKVGLIEAGTLPRKGAMPRQHRCVCALTQAGQHLTQQAQKDIGAVYDLLLTHWLQHHPYCRKMIERLHHGPLFLPECTSIKQLGVALMREKDSDAFAEGLASQCLPRLPAQSHLTFPLDQFEAVLVRLAKTVHQEVELEGSDAKRWIDAVQKRIVIPALLEVEGFPTDHVSFQWLMRALRDFLVVGTTGCHPEFEARLYFLTSDVSIDSQCVLIRHHGRSAMQATFPAHLQGAYDWLSKSGAAAGYVNAFAMRAVVCEAAGMQQRVFDDCLADLITQRPGAIATEVSFSAPPTGEDPIQVGNYQIGLIKLTGQKEQMLCG